MVLHDDGVIRPVDKKSIVPSREKLPSKMWAEILNANVFDLLLFHWVKRMYLERSACRSFDQESITN